MKNHYVRNFLFTILVPAIFALMLGMVFVYTRFEILMNVPVKSYGCGGFLPLFCHKTTPGGNVLSSLGLLTLFVSYNSPVLIPLRSLIFNANSGVMLVVGSIVGLASEGLLIDWVRYVLRKYYHHKG